MKTEKKSELSPCLFSFLNVSIHLIFSKLTLRSLIILKFQFNNVLRPQTNLLMSSYQGCYSFVKFFC